MRGRVRAGVLLGAVVLAMTLLSVTPALAAVPGQLMLARSIGSAAAPADGYDMAAGPGGVVAICGHIRTSGVDVPFVAKFSAAGKKLWLKSYAAAGQGVARAVAFDGKGDIYVGARLDGPNNGDIAVLRYSPGGSLRWVQTYNGPASGQDTVEDIAVTGSSGVVVTGYGRGDPDYDGIVVLKYTPAGMLAWPAFRVDPHLVDPSYGRAAPLALQVDGAGSIYVAGYEVTDVQHAYLLKLTSAGAKAWDQAYAATGGKDGYFESVALKGSTVAAVGAVFDDVPGGLYDALAATYDSGDGSAKHAALEWGAGNSTSEWLGDVVLDGAGNLFATGDQWSTTAADEWDKAVTLKVKANLSGVAWQKTYLPASRDAEGWFITRDGARGSLFVAGYATNKAGDEDFLTLRYSAAGKRMWVKTWAGLGSDDDGPEGIALGISGTVWIGGYGYGKGPVGQAILLKYKR